MVCGPGEGKSKTLERSGERLEQRAEPKPELVEARVVATMMRNFLVCFCSSVSCLLVMEDLPSGGE